MPDDAKSELNDLSRVRHWAAAGYLSVLPSELVLEIMERSDVRDIVSFHMTCHHFHDIVRSNPTLQYAITLFACGMEDNTRNLTPAPIDERLSRLQAHEDAWRNLRWTDAGVFTISIPPGPEWGPRFDGGIVLFNRRFTSAPTIAEVTRLGSELRGVKKRRWTLTAFSGSPGCYDPVQDLLTTHESPAAARVHFLTLSSGSPHPAASVPSLENCAWPIESVGDYVYYKPDNTLTTVYNWKTGQTKMVQSIDRNARYVMKGQVVLSVNCTIEGSTTLLTLSETAFTAPSPRRLASFGLPMDTRGPVYYCGAQKGCQGSVFDLQSQVTDAGNFVLDSNDCIIVFRAVERRGAQGIFPGKCVEIFVSVKDLERFVERERPTDSDGRSGEQLGTPPFVPWEEWGPVYAFPTLLRPSFVGVSGSAVVLPSSPSSLYGLRRVDSHPTRRDGEYVVRVYDYHPQRVARAEYLVTHASTGMSPKWTIKREGHLPDGSMVTTRPYLVTEMKLPQKLQDRESNSIRVHMCEDGIVISLRTYGVTHEDEEDEEDEGDKGSVKVYFWTI
ncbi:hypothetical protein OF83DRAFT_1122563 [Amylostereum chailletii]|nr:hypothetical protein OF83DRAFT_1122563 [Amylostereum chailletii]